MKERPILFNGPMVKAILDGRKTQTRRPVKPQPDGEWAAPGKTMCPYGQIGDRLWVRETWSVNFYGGHSSEAGDVYEHFGIEYRAGGEAKSIELDRHNKNLTRLYDTQRGDWRPSIFMPRWASRLTLEITEIKVHKLQDIGQGEAVFEGAPVGQEPIGWYSKIWDSIYSKSGLGWDANPWVRAISFKKFEGTKA